MNTPNITATPAAQELAKQLLAAFGSLVLYMGSYADPDQPRCLPENAFTPGSRDVLMGHVAGFKFYIARDRLQHYTCPQLELDVPAGAALQLTPEAPLHTPFTLSAINCSEEKTNLKMMSYVFGYASKWELI